MKPTIEFFYFLGSTYTYLSVTRAQALASGDETRAHYDAATARARELGIFGSPTFVVGTELFWGDDRLEDAIAWSQTQ